MKLKTVPSKSILSLVLLCAFSLLIYQNCGEFSARKGYSRSIASSSGLEINPEELAYNLASSILNDLKSTRGILHTIAEEENLSLECIRSGQGCSTVPNFSHLLNQYDIPIIYNEEGSIVWNGLNEQKGFDYNLDQCSDYSDSEGDIICAFRPQIFWHPKCGDGSNFCRSPEAFFYIRVNYRPEDLNFHYNFLSLGHNFSDFRNKSISECDFIGGVTDYPECNIARMEECSIVTGDETGTGHRLMGSNDQCEVLACNEGYFSWDGDTKCLAEITSCAINNGVGEAEFDFDLEQYGECVGLSCANDTYVMRTDKSECVSKETSCSISHGIGKKLFDIELNDYPPQCNLVSCNTNYKPNSAGTGCVLDAPPVGTQIGGNLSLSGTFSNQTVTRKRYIAITVPVNGLYRLHANYTGSTGYNYPMPLLGVSKNANSAGKQLYKSDCYNGFWQSQFRCGRPSFSGTWDIRLNKGTNYIVFSGRSRVNGGTSGSGTAYVTFRGL